MLARVEPNIRHRERIESLEEEIRQLRDRIAELEGEDGIEACRRVFGLTPSEAVIFSLLLKRGFANMDALVGAVYGLSDLAWPDDANWAVRHHMKRLRKRIKPFFGLRIETVYCMGYRMPEDARAAARAVLGAL